MLHKNVFPNLPNLFLVLLFFPLVALSTSASAQWTDPTPEELSMTSQPQVPGASAVYLYREEIQQDYLHMYSQYARIKVLTEGGKERANIELKYGGGDEHLQVTDIAGRTIHPDGTIVPFTGKPYARTIVKTNGYQEKATVFTLPDVTVGSIIEYRYKLRWEDNYFISPTWYIQNDLYLRKGHFFWKATDEQLNSSADGGDTTSSVAWMPILPAGVKVIETQAKHANFSNDRSLATLELNVQDIPPAPQEEYMPPLGSLSYRVMFYYTSFQTVDEFWKHAGKHWSAVQDKFIGPNRAVRDAVPQIVSASDTQEQKLKKIYAAVQQLENTDYTRQRSRHEDKSEGLKEVKTTDDIWTRKRGSSDEIAALFVAMARAAGMKAYVMGVTNRDTHIFLPAYLTTRQLDDLIAIVNIDGKDKFFDPGSRYCPYGLMEWKHGDSSGLRETDGGTALAGTPGQPFNVSGRNRVANLKMDETGVVSGTVDLKFLGEDALRWRHLVLLSDRDSLEHDLKESVERMLPGGMEIKVVSVDKLESYEEPLTAKLEVKGQVGSSTGKRLLIPGDLFETNSHAIFSKEKRELPISLSYRYTSHDAIRINLPPAFQIESVPASGSFQIPKTAVYNFKSEPDPKGVTIRRDLYMGEVLFMQKQYPDLRAFYSQFEAKDQEPIILRVAPAAPAGN
jgi:transglutaminase-like putative cysteine protease